MKSKTLLLTLFMLLSFGIARAETIQVGSGSNTSGLPVYTNWKYCLSQQIYTIAEIGRTGTITSLAFKATATPNQARNFDLYLVKTNKSSFSDKDDYITVSESNKVFSGTVSFTGGEWTTLNFSKPFAYDGSANLCVIVNDKTGSLTSFTNFQAFSGNDQALVRLNDNYGAYDPSSPGSVASDAGTPVMDYKNQLQLTFSEGGGSGSGETIQVGSGTKKDHQLPFGTNWNYSFSQQIYTIAEINHTGTITSIAFQARGDIGQARVLDIYLVKTTKSSFSSATDFVSCSESDKVFSGSVTFAVNDWTTIPFDNSFEYDGSANLCVIVNDKTGSYTGDGQPFLVYDATSQSLKRITDSASYDPASPGSTGSSTSTPLPSYKNQIQLTFTGGSGGGDDDIIGSGEATNSYLPTYNFYSYSLTQQIYTASELGAAKDLTSISFYNAGNEMTRNLDVYLVQTSKTGFAITDTENSKSNDWIPFTEADMVFSGEVTFTANKWTALPFFKTFSYDGTSNLALIVDDNTGEWKSNGISCRVFNATNQAIYIYSDGTNYNAAGLSSYAGTILSVKNQIKLNEKDIEVKLSNLVVTDITYNSATVSWHGGGSRWVLQYKPQAESEWNTISTMSQSYTLTDLSEETDYDVRVQIDFGDDTYSEFIETQFETPEQYPRPTYVKLLAVTPYTAAFDWIENGTATEWQIDIYDGTDDLFYVVDSKPYIVTGLKQGTNYKMWVRAIIDAENEIYGNWSNGYSFTTPEVNPVPTDIAVSTTPTSATISWEGKSDSYVVKYRKLPAPSGTTFDFDDGTLQGWTTIDADGDGNTWVSSAEPGIYHNSGADLTGEGYDGSAHFVLSGSYANQTGQVLTPDNYLVSPSMELGGKIGFYACAQDAAYAAEHFGVAVSTTGNTNASDFTTIAEWTLTAAGTPSSRRKDQGTWGLFEVDLSDYKGQTGYVAIRHFGCSDQFILNIDDINIVSYDEVVEEPWQTIETTDNTVTINGLESATTYQYEVIGIVKGNEDASSSIRRFTTLEANPMPTDVAVTTTNTTATISWTGYSDGYVVRYREANVVVENASFYEDFESGFDAQGWTLIKAGEAPNSTGFVCQVDEDETLGNGTNVATSYSWTSAGAYHANNWLISPLVDLEGTLRYWEIAGWSEEYEVLLSTTGKDISDFTTTLRPKTAALSSWNSVEIDLSAYEGQQGYIAFHHEFYNGMHLNLDDVCIYTTTTVPGQWQMTGGFDTTITIDGLKPNTEYEFYIMGALKTGEISSETEIFTFITAGDPIDLALDNNADNGSTLGANDGAFANVTINNLTLKKDGKWQAIYLPFDVDVENSILAGADVRTLESAKLSWGVLVLNCLTPVTKMEAGVPYIIKWDSGEDIVNPVFNEVTIHAALSDYIVDGVEFDEISYKAITASSDFIACFPVAGDPILSYITMGFTLPAFEPYFFIGDLYYSCNTVVLNTGDVDDLLDGINSVKGNAEDEVIYNMAGQRLAKKQRGINIINGKKVLVK